MAYSNRKKNRIDFETDVRVEERRRETIDAIFLNSIFIKVKMMMAEKKKTTAMAALAKNRKKKWLKRCNGIIINGIVGPAQSLTWAAGV